MSLYKIFRTDEAAEREGVWLEYATADGKPPARIKIARAGGSNARYGRVFEAKTKPYRRQMQLGTLDDKTSERLYAELYAETVVLAWENVEDEQGAKLPFTRENVVKILTDLPELFADVRLQANRLAPFRAVEREADSGN